MLYLIVLLLSLLFQPVSIDWALNYAATLHIIACGEYILSGTDGNSMRFVTDDAGWSLDFRYERKSFHIDGRLQLPRPVIVRIDGPQGLRLDYDYDSRGNLVRAQRRIEGISGAIDEGYAYSELYTASGTDQRGST